MTRYVQRSVVFRTHLIISFVFLASIGLLFNNWKLFSVVGFSVTLPYLLFSVAAILAIFTPNLYNRRNHQTDLVYFLAFGLIVMELFRSLTLKHYNDTEWWKSFLLYITSIVSFMLVIRITPNQKNFDLLAKLAVYAGIFFTFIQVVNIFWVQTNGQLLISVPLSMRISTYGLEQMLNDVQRTGTMRINSLSSEPAHLNTGFLSLLLFIGVLYSKGYYNNTNRYFLASLSISILMLVLFSASIAAYSMLLAILVGVVFSSNLRLSILIMFIMAIAVYIFLQLPSLEGVRFRIIEAIYLRDTSTQVRVLYPFRLMFYSTSNPMEWLLGLGLGRVSEKYFEVVTNAYGIYGYRLSSFSADNLQNSFAVLRLWQGWTGLVHYVVFLIILTRRNLTFALYIFALHIDIAKVFTVDIWSFLAISYMFINAGESKEEN